ncbi:hypothetical protein N7492_006330 [Penicillium capsulatum]|uniref:Peptidase S8/S53 domain-containing protein n=1 Tax=Penicillium capsulatum TaxID=69766 RepID=A0A9W9I186_9EURO|nr:hypothetical protein N7492_006330 [Penicillium capsulatum]KAJ6108979.1 hypothetical protein N7512_008816 [Penicillium capsulatum]
MLLALIAILVVTVIPISADDPSLALRVIYFEDFVPNKVRLSIGNHLADLISKEDIDVLMIEDQVTALVALMTNEQSKDFRQAFSVIALILTDKVDGNLLAKGNDQIPWAEPPSPDPLLAEPVSLGDGELVWQEDAPPELKFLSIPKSDQVPADQPRGYLYRNLTWTGVKMYAQDTGVNWQHNDFQPGPGVPRTSVSYLRPASKGPGGYFNRIPEPEKDHRDHGTCVADKAVGRKFGVFKGGTLKMIHLERWSEAWALAGLQAMLDDMKRQTDALKGKAVLFVVNMSYSSANSKTAAGQRSIALQQKYFQALVDLGALIVVAAGNDEGPVNGYPALFAQVDSLRKNMIVVGGVRHNGGKSARTKTDPLIDVFAPAFGIFREKGKKPPPGVQCAGPDSADEVVRHEGTSMAAPQVAALAAYFYSVHPELRESGLAAQKVKAKIIETAYQRVGSLNNPLAIYNGEYPLEEEC